VKRRLLEYPYWLELSNLIAGIIMCGLGVAGIFEGSYAAACGLFIFGLLMMLSWAGRAWHWWPKR